MADKLNRIRIGEITITSLLEAWLPLDGGAMFGIIPKVMWNEQIPSDEKNRIKLAMRPLLVQTPEHTLVLESGIGHALDDKRMERYGVERIGPTLDELVKAAGVDPAEVDIVAHTHLHWDHSGGICRLEEGKYVPNFPNAKHIFQRGEWEIATNPDNLHRGSYMPASLKPVEEDGLLELVEGDAEIAPGVSYELSRGHTDNHAVIWLQSGDESGCFLGDLVPTTAHVPLPWISAYDIHAGESYEFRKRLYPKLIERNAVCFFYHDPGAMFGMVTESDGKYSGVPIS